MLCLDKEGSVVSASSDCGRSGESVISALEDSLGTK